MAIWGAKPSLGQMQSPGSKTEKARDYQRNQGIHSLARKVQLLMETRVLKATKRASIPVYRVCFVRAGLCEREKVPRLLIRVSREGSHV